MDTNKSVIKRCNFFQSPKMTIDNKTIKFYNSKCMFLIKLLKP